MAKAYLLFILAYVGLLSAAVFRDAVWGIYLYVLVYFVAPWTKWWGYMLPNIRWVMIVGLANLVSWLIRHQRYAHHRLRDAKPILVFVAMTLLMAVVGLWAVWPERHWEMVDKQVKVLLALLVMYKVVNTPQRFEGLLWVYCFGVFFVGWEAWGAGRSSTGRLEGVGTIDSLDANDTGAILMTGIPLLLFYVMEGKKLWIRIASLVFLPWVLNGLILVNSRGAFLGMLVAIAIYFGTVFAVGKKSFGFKMKVVVGAIAGLVLFYFLADPVFWSRQSTLTAGNEGGDHLDYGRFEFWKYAYLLAKENPWGVGGWGFTYLSSTFLPVELMAGDSTKAVHSTFFEALSAYGFLGLALLVYFLHSAFRQIQGHIDVKVHGDADYLRLQRIALISTFTGFLVCATFIDRLYCEVLYYFPVIFCIFRAIYLQDPAAAAETTKVALSKSRTQDPPPRYGGSPAPERSLRQ